MSVHVDMYVDITIDKRLYVYLNVCICVCAFVYVFVFVCVRNMTEKFTHFITLNEEQIRQEGTHSMEVE